MAAGGDERQAAIRKLLTSVVAQFVERTGHGPGDLRQFERLAGDLIDVADRESVADVAEQLCRHPETPPALIARFFNRGGACARIAFEFAKEAPLAELLANAEHGSMDVAAAIARRPDLPREAVSALAQRCEAQVMIALASNRNAHIDPGALRAMLQIARDDRALARALLDREDMEIDPEPLFLAANGVERSAILLAACRAAMLAPKLEFRVEADFSARLVELAISRNFDALVTKIADALDARKNRVRRIFEDEGGEALALTFVALGVDVDAATKIFLCGDWPFSQDHARLRGLRALMRSSPPRAAMRIVAAINGATRLDRDFARRLTREEGALQAGAWRRTLSASPSLEGPRRLRFDKSS